MGLPTVCILQTIRSSLEANFLVLNVCLWKCWEREFKKSLPYSNLLQILKQQKSHLHSIWRKEFYIFAIELKEKRETDRTIVNFIPSHEIDIEGCKTVMLAFQGLKFQSKKRTETRASSNGVNEPYNLSKYQDLQVGKIK